MITTNLKGGIGNQMFQIAATEVLAQKMKVRTQFDFNSCYTPAQGNTSNKYRDNIFNLLIDGKINPQDFKVYNEPNFSYNELPMKDNLILNGFFQSSKYFEGYEEHVLGLFDTFDSDRHERVYDFLMEISPDDISVTGIHVRRGDYLTKPNFHPVCTVEYYQKAMEEIGDSVFVFISDDIKWCKENFRGPNIVYSPFTNELDDLYLLQNCDNQIIANSSFSWWAAYLCEWEDNKVIAPSVWFGSQGPQDTQDIIPEDWIKI